MGSVPGAEVFGGLSLTLKVSRSNSLTLAGKITSAPALERLKRCLHYHTRTAYMYGVNTALDSTHIKPSFRPLVFYTRQ